MNEYQINDLYGYTDYAYLDAVIRRVFQHENVEHALVSIIFVDEEMIQNLNREMRGIDKVTDVISFALEDGETCIFEELRVLGDIYICIPRMIEQALDYGHSEKRELSFLVVHGLLHLLGYDHMEAEDEKKMFSLQEEILNEEGITR